MDTTAVLEELVLLLGFDLVHLVQKEKHVATQGGLSARGA
jgi:hypothetical protein